MLTLIFFFDCRWAILCPQLRGMQAEGTDYVLGFLCLPGAYSMAVLCHAIEAAPATC